MNGREKRYMVLVGKPEGKEDLGSDGSIILRWF